ncbi:Exonuclease V subunit beta [Ignavibacterium album JCM 16511]|uniref:DNA 3'-5' helicase n=1 Tax=Ignavibacterium album (strain DSM 19864 / JCM 16511 / NBRC 101810 / Mat9-16) TaxID=945713 RepID=I0ALN5_IGNAJ|nr:UvrD-helicase domain-containing protein [Ignavibacterium album]AFH49892.1 Exonuclease V subunit beta [Ignavibacterium album JCM 16511]
MLTPHQQKAVTLDDHLALTANAGSGKTFVLSRKYLEAAIKLDGQVSSIAAITFTEKAASELYQKISELIDNEIKETRDNQRIKVLEKIRRNLVSAYISTIHSFCIDILREFPVEAGIDANFTPIDQSLANELLELAVEETIDEYFNDTSRSEIVKRLLRYFSRKSVLQKELMSLIDDRKNVLKVKEEIYSKSDEEIIKNFNEKFEIIFNEIWSYYENDFIHSLKKINNSVLANNLKSDFALNIKYHLEEFERNRNPIELLQNIKKNLLTDKHEVRKQKYLVKDLQTSLEREIRIVEKTFSELEMFTRVSDGELYPDLIKLAREMLMLFDRTLQLYEIKKKEESYIDFEDILLFTKELLKNQDVQSYISSKFRYLMVDEFQDTNELQYEIFLPILDYLKSGKLFIVGDEKQSIYKFRDAELEIFHKTKDDIVKERNLSHLMELPDSFRMNEEICLFTNYVFNRLFEKDIPLFGELKNVPIVCAKEKKRDGEICFLISKGDEENPSQAELVAGKIIQLVSTENYNFGDITILVRKRKSFDELEKIFIKKNIPYSIIGGRGFYQRQVINDIYNYLSVMLNQEDDAALVGILRSPFFTIPDTTIFEISLQPGKSIYDKLKNFPDKGRLEKVKQVLQTHIDLSASLTLTQLLNQILSDTGYLAVIHNRIDGEQEIANIKKLFSLSRNFDSKGYRNLYDFVNSLKEAVQSVEDEPQAAVSSALDAVQIMTVHQAKGLEFPVVILFKTEDYGQSAKLKSKSIFVNKHLGLLAKIPDPNNPTGDYVSLPITQLNDFIEKKKNLAEIKRLLYVAITRAKEKLFITAEIKEDKEPNKESFIYLLKDALNFDFENDILIEDVLEYLVQKENKFINEKKTLEIKIPVIHNAEFINETVEKAVDTRSERKYIIQKYQEKEKSQMISATRISVYSQCPLKYHLTYNLGFALLNKLLPQWKDSSKIYNEYYFDEDIFTDNVIENESETLTILKNSSIKSEKIGEIIHKILQLELDESETLNFIKRQVKQIDINEITAEETINQISDLIKTFRETEVFKEISAYKNYKNEFEIYLKKNSYFLHGILDKIIFEKNKILIIDYKTDDVDEKSVSQKFEEYSNQLKFYLYISSQLFNDYEKFEARLIFLRMPDREFKLNYSSENISELKNEISAKIEGIVSNSFSKKLNHCNHCQFSTAGNCVVN